MSTTTTETFVVKIPAQPDWSYKDYKFHIEDALMASGVGYKSITNLAKFESGRAASKKAAESRKRAKRASA
jgi:uncharacterized protein YbjT (DUF2867 family)